MSFLPAIRPFPPVAIDTAILDKELTIILILLISTKGLFGLVVNTLAFDPNSLGFNLTRGPKIFLTPRRSQKNIHVLARWYIGIIIMNFGDI